MDGARGENLTSVIAWTEGDLAEFIVKCRKGPPTPKNRDSVYVTEFPQELLDAFEDEFLPEVCMPVDEVTTPAVVETEKLFWYSNGGRYAIGVAHKGYLWAFQHAAAYFAIPFPLVWLSGSPGTGKSISIQLLLQIFIQAAEGGKDQAGGFKLPQALILWCRIGVYFIQRRRRHGVDADQNGPTTAEHPTIVAVLFENIRQAPTPVWPKNREVEGMKELLERRSLREAVEFLGGDTWQVSEKLEGSFGGGQLSTKEATDFKPFGPMLAVASEDWLARLLKAYDKQSLFDRYPIIGLPSWTRREFVDTVIRAMDVDTMCGEDELHAAAGLLSKQEWQLVRGNSDGAEDDEIDVNDMCRTWRHASIEVAFSVAIRIRGGRLLLTPGQQSYTRLESKWRGIEEMAEQLRDSNVTITDDGVFVEVRCESFIVKTGKRGNWQVQVTGGDGKLLFSRSPDQMRRRLRFELLVWLLFRGTNPRKFFSDSAPVPDKIDDERCRLDLSDAGFAGLEDPSLQHVKKIQRQRMFKAIADKLSTPSHSVFVEVTGCYLCRKDGNQLMETEFDRRNEEYITKYSAPREIKRDDFYINRSAERLMKPLNKLAFRWGLAETLEQLLFSEDVKCDYRRMALLFTLLGGSQYGDFFELVCHSYMKTGGRYIEVLFPAGKELMWPTEEIGEELLKSEDDWTGILENVWKEVLEDDRKRGKWRYVRPFAKNYRVVDAYLMHVREEEPIDVVLLQMTTTRTHRAIDIPTPGSKLVKAARKVSGLEPSFCRVFVVPNDFGRLTETTMLTNLEQGSDMIMAMPSLQAMAGSAVELRTVHDKATQREPEEVAGDEPIGRKRYITRAESGTRKLRKPGQD